MPVTPEQMIDELTVAHGEEAVDSFLSLLEELKSIGWDGGELLKLVHREAVLFRKDYHQVAEKIRWIVGPYDWKALEWREKE